MAYQPLYATISDTNATRHTTSLRSRVEWINFWLNSHFGSVLKVSADSQGSAETKDTYEAEQKIKMWEEKSNLKKVDLWKRKLQEREEYNKEEEKKENVFIDIDLQDNPKYTFCINGITIKASDLKLLAEFKKKDFLGKLAIASSFALIPDIKKVIDKEPNALENFKEKKKNITNFLKEEEAKIKV